MGVYVTKRCPHCKAELSFQVGLGADTTIGSPLEPCPTCGNLYRTARSEWQDKSSAQKFAFFLRVMWWTLGGLMYLGAGGGVLGALAAWIVSKVGVALTMQYWIIGGVVSGLILAPVLAARRAYKDITESIRRTSKNRRRTQPEWPGAK